MWRRLVVLGTVGGLTIVSACSSSTGSGGGFNAGGSSGASAAGGSFSGGSGGSFNLDGGGASSSGGTLNDGQACTGDVQTGQQIPLDMYIMLDSSGSMLDTIAGGQTKWAAVRQALTAFAQNMQSDGLGVGLQYFPIRDPSVPTSCTSSAQCGARGPCVLRTCDGGSTVQPCNTTADCQGNGSCVTLGICSLDQGTLCIPVGTSCGAGQGACVALNPSFCAGGTSSCLVGDYANPAVPIAMLPGVRQQLVNSLNGKMPEGDTPTGPALQGAINYARTWATQNPTHRVITVLATDGLPTSCNPTDINQLGNVAAMGLSGSPSISTFVIGVFAPGDMGAAQNLNTIANGGGTAPAIMVNTSQNVSQQFLDALNKIRGNALACEFQLPTPPMGQQLDYNKVNVEFTDGNGAQQSLLYVGSAAGCGASGGWYYDVDPATGGVPTKIIVCDSNCDVFKATTGGSVNIRLGCATQVP